MMRLIQINKAMILYIIVRMIFSKNFEDVHSNDLKTVSFNVCSVPKNLLKIPAKHAV